MAADEKLLTVSETSALLNKPEVTIKRYARESLIPCIKVDGNVMFSESAVHNYLKIEKQFK